MTTAAARSVVALTTITVQPVLTTLLAARDLSGYSDLLFAFLCDDLANGYDVTIETGEASDALDGGFVGSIYVPPAAGGKRGQNSLVVGPNQLRSYYRVAATARGGGALAGAWILRGAPRLVRWRF